jgi:hypothetical protein
VSKRGDTGKYKVKLSNKFGEDKGEVNVVVLDKPQPPESLKVDEVFADNCKVSWEPPSDDGGGEILAYTVEKQVEGSSLWEKCPGIIRDNALKVEELEPGKKYNFRVKATNAYGTSDPIETDRPILAKNPFGELYSFSILSPLLDIFMLADPPSDPKDLVIDKFDSSSVSLKWKPPMDDGGNPIKGTVLRLAACVA